jgi:hypothetical protein
MWTSVSNTAEYGGLAKGDLVINDKSKEAMEKMLDDIIEGRFAKEWMKDAKGGMKKLQAMEKKVEESNIEVVGKEIRALFEAQPGKKPAAKKAPAKKAAPKKPAAKAPAKKAVKTAAVKPAAKKAPAKKPAAKKAAPKKPAAKKAKK